MCRMINNSSESIADFLYDLCLDDDDSRVFYYGLLAYFVVAVSVVAGLLLWVALEARRVVRRRGQEPVARSGRKTRGGRDQCDMKATNVQEQELDSIYAFLSEEVKEISR